MGDRFVVVVAIAQEAYRVSCVSESLSQNGAMVGVTFMLHGNGRLRQSERKGTRVRWVERLRAASRCVPGESLVPAADRDLNPPGTWRCVVRAAGKSIGQSHSFQAGEPRAIKHRRLQR